MNASTRPNAEAVPPRNAADAAARFACPVLGQMTGARCVELFRDSMRVRSACSGCAAGKARSRLLAERPVQVVEIATEDPRVLDLLAEVRRLTARLARVEVQLETVRAQRRKAPTKNVRLLSFGFSTAGMDVDALQAWCRRHQWSLSHLVRTAVREAAHGEGVDLEPLPSTGMRGFSVATPKDHNGCNAPESWRAFLDGLRRRRHLSPYVRSAITAYMEAHP